MLIGILLALFELVISLRQVEFEHERVARLDLLLEAQA